MKQEKKLLDLQFEKKLQEIHQLEEELETVKQSLKQSQNFAEEMKSELCIHICRTPDGCSIMHVCCNPLNLIVN